MEFSPSSKSAASISLGIKPSTITTINSTTDAYTQTVERMWQNVKQSDIYKSVFKREFINPYLKSYI